MNTFKIAVLPGDGIGPEITDEVVKILKKTSEKFAFGIELNYGRIGGAAIDAVGIPLEEETIDLCQKSDAIFLGAVGHHKYNDLPLNIRPETGLLQIRKALGVFANIRPGMILTPLKSYSPLKPEIIGEKLDVCIVRELTGGIYFGEHHMAEDEKSAYDKMMYSEAEIERIAHTAFKIAMQRNKRLTSVDKANVLASSRLWRKTVEKVAKQYPEVKLDHLYVDNAAMQLVINPRQFDVILTSNMFGDILSDEMSVITGSIGVLASASLDANQKGLYEPIHGSAPDIAGMGIANPIASILSIAMMMRFTFNRGEVAEAIESAVDAVLGEGYRTKDICKEGDRLITTSEMGNRICDAI
ncbi:MAG: 3-isopropylmalate dehydrogenase [Clostridiales bacterium]|nr:3-isopropylmalate dehydrogenase [Clostridiales bacterium]